VASSLFIAKLISEQVLNQQIHVGSLSTMVL